ncbi:acid phosphatase [Gluconobacter sphaericus NBRC 12467]|uniref:Acid phosphatase n=2 Tax=Gluconobacter sphaericus TaxID=574987 RepID=A0AA37SHU9_9PROT|nr:acid phosphatase [Gluconobacter sphaericus NBRC 12467]GEB43270.1 acid phosphatase [Gluconobacter sphaericus NBRC 12467]GLQ85997.1 acid phosphatase [Gluconobacter sphaericus NBRC 12467]
MSDMLNQPGTFGRTMDVGFRMFVKPVDRSEERFCKVFMKRVQRAKSGLAVLLSGSVLFPSMGLASSVAASYQTATPIKHVVVIFQENRSFDHYFATYPKAANVSGEPAFTALADTPSVNNLTSANLLTNNPNSSPANGMGTALPFRIDRTQANTADQNHSYTPEQQAYDGGKMDLFPKYTGSATYGSSGAFGTKGQVLGYFDGNTVTALWSYAQHYAMSDNNWSDTYGPSTPGALEIVSGQTNGLQPIAGNMLGNAYIHDGQGGYTLINDEDPAYDRCSTSSQVRMNAKNIGDLLNEKGISWGGFMGGFDLTLTNANNTTGCSRSTYSEIVGTRTDYVPHHAWFQYFASTANPTHARPNSTASIGFSTIPGTSTREPANHQYDIKDFYKAVKAGNFSAVSYIKMPAYQDAHPGNSDPLDEQNAIVTLVNFIQSQPEWASTAIIIDYDDSDGWYDHAFHKPLWGSFDSIADQLNGPGICGTAGSAPKGVAGKVVNGRCGPGTRIPLIVISPYARRNFVSHDLTSQASVVRFIEDNWLGGKRLGGGSFDAAAGQINTLFDFTQKPNTTPLVLDPDTGSLR